MKLTFVLTRKNTVKNLQVSGKICQKFTFLQFSTLACQNGLSEEEII